MLWLKRGFKVVVLLVLGLMMLYGIARLVVVYRDSQLDGERAPYLQMMAPDSVVLRWQTREASRGRVRIGEQLPQLDQVFGEESEPTRLHEIRLTGLKPDTRYFYEVLDDQGRKQGGSEAYWFRTSPPIGTTRSTRIWVIGDSGEAGPLADQVRDAAWQWARHNPRAGYPEFDVWISLGDLAYRSGTDDQFQAAVFETYADALRNLALWPAFGNHDARRWTYFRVFSLPEQGEAGGIPSGTEHYYSFDYGDVHVVVLDSENETGEAGTAMHQWLQRDLAANTGRWLIAVFHHPPYSKGSHDSDKQYGSNAGMGNMRRNLLPLLESAGVDLVLGGHSHMYERSWLLDCHYGDSETFDRRYVVSDGLEHRNAQYLKPSGLTPHAGAVYVVAGSSSKVDQGPLDHPALPVGLLETGSVVIDIENDTLTSRFINSQGEVRDAFSVTKQVDYQPAYAGCKG